ncbi:MAG: hypothetical protein HY897_14530 [Deltaproteobacteria bacterium]|nr:hypothetical protein [Deltaproteobacteria bacterium]
MYRYGRTTGNVCAGMVAAVVAALALILAGTPTASKAAPAAGGEPTPRQFHLRGFPRALMWITMVGDPSAGFVNDAEASARVQKALNIDPRLLAFIFPKSDEGKISFKAPDAGVLQRFVSSSDLPGLFGRDTEINRRVLELGIERPDLVVLVISSHGERNGLTKWGDGAISLETLGALLASVHGTYQAPVLLVLDKCHAGSTQTVLSYLNAQKEWRENTYLMMSSLSGQDSYSQTFVSSWEHRRHLWPSLANDPVLEQQVFSAFRAGKEYGRLVMSLLVGMLGAAPDAAGNGIDATDLCRFADEAEKARQQPPISERYRADVFCNADMRKHQAESEWSSRFAIISPSISIEFDPSPPPFSGGEALANHLLLLNKFKSTVEKRAEDLGYSSANTSVSFCSPGARCGNPWKCWLDWDGGRGYRGNCLHVPRGERIPGRWSPLEKDLLASFERIAQRALVPPWSPAAATLTPPPLEMKLTTPAPHLVLMDASLSMMANDPDGAKRRSFFLYTLHPLIAAKKVQQLYVASFADRAARSECFNAQTPDIDRARKCFDGKIGARKGGTYLMQAVEETTYDIPKDTIVWVLTDGIDTKSDRVCEAKYPSCTGSEPEISCKPEQLFKECAAAYDCWGAKIACDTKAGIGQCDTARDAIDRPCREKELACEVSVRGSRDGTYVPATYACDEMWKCRSAKSAAYGACITALKPGLDECIIRYHQCRGEREKCIGDPRFAHQKEAYRQCEAARSAQLASAARCYNDKKSCCLDQIALLASSMKSRYRQLYPVFLKGISGNADTLAALAQIRPSDETMLILDSAQTPEAWQQKLELFVRKKMMESVETLPKGDYTCREEGENRWSCMYEIKELPLVSGNPIIKIPFLDKVVRNVMITYNLTRWLDGATDENDRQRMVLLCNQQNDVKHISSGLSFRLKCSDSVLQIEIDPSPGKPLRQGVWRMRIEYEFEEKGR